MDVHKVFAPTGANKGVLFVTLPGFLRLENAFKECALEIDYVLPNGERKEKTLSLLLEAKKACTLPEASVQVQNTPAQAKQTEKKEETENVEVKQESKPQAQSKGKKARGKKARS